MTMGSIPRRYARALFGLAVEKARVDAWSEALQSLSALVAGDPDLRDLFENPAHAASIRGEAIRKLSGAARLEPELENFLLLLSDRRRLGAVGEIAAAYRELADRELGRVRARVTSAVPLDDAAAAAIAARLSSAAAAKVIVERQVDPAILGGVVAQVGSIVYDGSLRGQLATLRQTLKH